MTAVLEVKNVTKTFANVGKLVLNNISLTVEKGDFISILGASGSGKSTLLTIMGGMDRPDVGEIVFDGKDLAKSTERELAELRRTKMGFVFQFFNLAPYLTVEENIILPCVLDGKSDKTYGGELNKLTDYLKLNDLLKKLPSKLSGGEQQRVAIARGLIYKPEIIFLDEPTGNLDSATAKEIMELLKSINETIGTTILQVTHSEKNALYGNRIVRIADGAIIEESVADGTEAAE